MTPKTVTIRPAQHADDVALRRLAALDSQRLPEGDLIVAEVGGELRAAVPVAGGQAIADPFHLTRDVVALLSERVAQLRDRGAQRRTALRLHPAGA
jgi:hypothetical protein